ncbi:MAG: GNAT family N-acetyltransferase [Shimia sp.]|nr:GNAT family N-acetyltransferase [Shimia sp.]MCP4825162.1 GNAT family N-acetyltransferase [Shimia sp.]
MSQITVQKGSAADLRQTAELLNEIIAIGGTTALIDPLSREEISGWLLGEPDRSVWHVAMDTGGKVLGFQWVGPFGSLPPEACEIGTFVKAGRTGLGIGSKLFEATKSAARTLGYDWINAEIRADNTGGLAYYQSRSFEDYGRKDGVVLQDGTEVSKVLKRYNL